MAGIRRIHLVHFTSQPGGIEILLSRNLSSFPLTDFSIFILRPPIPDGVNVYKDKHVNLTYGSLNNIQAFFYLWKYGYKFRKELFHVFNLGPFFLLALRLAGVRNLIYSIRGTKYWGNSGQKLFKKILWNLGTAKTYNYIANSEYSKSVFLDKINFKASISVLYNPIACNIFYTIPIRNKKEVLKIVYSGRLNKGKGLEKWIDIACRLHNVYENSIYEIYGIGPLMQELKDKIISIGAFKFIVLKGFMEKPAEIYQNADVLLFLSEYESFGNVVVESILCGTPVIASSIPSMKEIFQNYPEFLVDLDENLENNIIEKIRNIDELKIKAREAAIEFRSRFSMEQHIEKLEEIYNSFNE